MKAEDSNSIPKTAFVLFNNGAFGGAEKRFSGLFQFLNAKYPGRFYFFINNHLLSHIDRIYPDFPKNDIRIADFKNVQPQINDSQGVNGPNAGSVSKPRVYYDIIPDPLEVDRKAGIARKIYWFQKNKIRQRQLFNTIEKYRKVLGIEVMMGIFSGVSPLVFYLNRNPRKVSIIFSDMDSWFTDVHSDMNRLWYRKYYSFNYALENSDLVDFLSPFIVEGVRKRNVKIADERISITACSFADYSKCASGPKSDFEIAFSARLEPDKNPILFLEAALEVLKEYPETKFHMLGEGSLVREINGFISSNNLTGNVNFRFHKNPPEVFAGTRVFVSLQTGTNYPSQSVIEAMACGNAIIASDTGDTNLLVKENNGLLIGLNKAELVNALKKLIASPSLAASLGEKGREFVMANHTIEEASEYYVELFRKAYKKVFIS